MIANALRSLNHNQKDPSLVLSNSKLVNSAFPGDFVPSAKSIASKLRF